MTEKSAIDYYNNGCNDNYDNDGNFDNNYDKKCEKGPINLGMGKPPPPFGQCPKENVHLKIMFSLIYM